MNSAKKIKMPQVTQPPRKKKKFTCFNKQLKPFDPYSLQVAQIKMDKQNEEAEVRMQEWLQENKDKSEEELDSTDFTQFISKETRELATDKWTS